jgi:hypothetical protein
VNTRTLLLMLFLASTGRSSELPAPNRGTQLFVLISERHVGTLIVAMTPTKRPVLQLWNRYNPTYDFVSALVRHTASGSKVAFTRYVMADDYIPRVEHLDLVFTYTEQQRYRFFDIGSIVGFYRNSTHDIEPFEFMPDHKHLTKR